MPNRQVAKLASKHDLSIAEVLQLGGKGEEATGDAEKDGKKMVDEDTFVKALAAKQSEVKKSSRSRGRRSSTPHDADDAARDEAARHAPAEDRDVIDRVTKVSTEIVPRGRSRAVLDPAAVAWLKAARDRYQELRSSDFGRIPEGDPMGLPATPRLLPHGGTGYKYVDPLDDLLEPEDFQGEVFRPNHILLSQEQRDHYNRFPWRSREFTRAVERRLNSLWLSLGDCKGCLEPIESGFTGEVKEFLDGKYVLPGETKKGGAKAIRPPSYHDVCYLWRHEMRDLDINLQDYLEDDPEAVKYRYNYYLEATERIFVRMREIDEHITKSEVVAYFRKNLQAREAARAA